MTTTNTATAKEKVIPKRGFKADYIETREPSAPRKKICKTDRSILAAAMRYQ